MRCPNCEKFVAYDTEVEPEEESAPEVSPDGQFTASYRRVLTCEECSEELKDTTIEFDEPLAFPEPKGEEPKEKCEHEFDVGDLNVAATTGVIDRDRKGNKITNRRYMATTYGVSLDGKATCSKCKLELPIAVETSERASSFNELV